jgi:tetratricopeptide (TPR) repeat protein
MPGFALRRGSSCPNEASVSLLLALLLQTGPVTLAVFPPDGPSAGPAVSWVGEAVADSLPRALALLGTPVVDRADRLRVQAALGLPAGPLTRATCIEIAAALGASRLVVGSYDVQGPDLALSLRLLDVERGTLSAPFMSSGPLENVAERIYGLAWDIALAGPTRPTLTREELLARRPTVPFSALKAYAEGLSVSDPAARVKLLRRVLLLVPSFDAARLALGRLNVEAREHQSALDVLGPIKRESPLARQARFLQGVALLELGRYREAGALYAVLAQEEPSAAVLNNHAVALLRLNLPGQRASEVFRKAVELAPGSTDLPFNLAWALLAEGEPEAAAFWLHGVTREQPRDAHARLVLVWALRKSKRDEEAAEEWKGLVALAPSLEAFGNSDLSRRFERILPAERLVLLDQDRKKDAELAAACMARAERLSQSGDLDASLRELARGISLDPYGARVHWRMGGVLLARGEKEKAVDEFRISLWCRDDPAVRVELAELLKELGLSAEARAEAEKVMKTDPGNERARRVLGP